MMWYILQLQARKPEVPAPELQITSLLMKNFIRLHHPG
jgi:hypothetical protein